MLVFSRQSRFILIAAAIIVFAAAVYGCTRSLKQTAGGDQRIIARINNYKMSASDFQRGVDFILASKYLSIEPNQAKEQLLDELIANNILVQEAQRQNLDKQRPFMIEIEKYWEQSLLKLLLNKKSEEIAEQIRVEDGEIINEYVRMKRRLFAQLIMVDELPAAEQLSRSGNKFDQVKEQIKAKIVSQELPEWWSLGDLPRYLEEVLFALKVGETSGPVECGNNWAVIRLLDEKKIEIERFENLSAAIKANITKRKKEDELKKWIESLRSKASIKINKGVLRETILE